METEGVITVQYNYEGELLWVNMGNEKGEQTEPFYDLVQNPPPGTYKGFVNLGRLYFYEQADGSIMRCTHRRCKIF
jgi:hypothetical protein